jgi:hypothetical protein
MNRSAEECLLPVSMARTYVLPVAFTAPRFWPLRGRQRDRSGRAPRRIVINRLAPAARPRYVTVVPNAGTDLGAVPREFPTHPVRQSCLSP